MKKKRLYDKNGIPWHLGEDAYYFAQYVSSWDTEKSKKPASKPKAASKAKPKNAVPPETVKKRKRQVKNDTPVEKPDVVDESLEGHTMSSEDGANDDATPLKKDSDEAYNALYDAHLAKIREKYPNVTGICDTTEHSADWMSIARKERKKREKK